MKKVISTVLCLVMILALLPVKVSAAVIGDDYPWKSSSGGSDDWGYVVRNCTSLVAWRLHSQNGFEAPRGMGNAKFWGGYAQSKGYTVDMNPAVGSVAWSSSGDYGHVAWVADVSGNNVVIEEYNAKIKTDVNPSGVGLVYNRRTVSKSSFSGYIHFKDIGGGTTQPSTAPTKPIVASDKASYVLGERITFTWDACANADWYDFNLREVGGSGRSYYYDSSVVGKSTILSFPSGIPSGVWQAQVVACNSRNGLQTNSSDWYSLVVSTITYTVTYNANGGSGPPPAQTKTKDVTLYLSSTKPTRTGYDFRGWSTSSTATSATYQPGGAYTGNANLTLYAVWVRTYTITFNANGGTGEPASQTKRAGEDIILSSIIPTRTGYTFLCWQTSQGNAYYSGEKYTKDGDITLYANWVQYGGILSNGTYEYALSSDGSEAIFVRALSPIIGAFTIPSTLGGKPVTKVDFHAFYDSSQMTSLTIPASVTTLNEVYSNKNGTFWFYPNAFDNCSSLKNIYVDSNNRIFASVDGVLFDKSKTQLLAYPQGRTDTSYIVPNSVVRIGYKAFYKSSNLLSITLPDSVTTLGLYSFGSSGLTSIKLNSVVEIEVLAFFQCPNLTSCYLGKSVSTIGEQAFSGCNKLAEINVDADNMQYASMDGVLFSKDKATLVMFPPNKNATNYLIPTGTCKIESNAFSSSSKLINVTVPETVVEIGDGAFWNCVNLETIMLADGVTRLGEMAFANCGKIRTIVFPSSASVIGSGLTLRSPNVVIYCYAGSSAQQYAVSEQIPYVLINSTNSYSICLDPNGGDGLSKSQVKVKDIGSMISAYMPVRGGFTFQGWATSSTATTPQYQPGQYYTANAPLTLYAVWKSDYTKIVYDANGGDDISLVELTSSNEVIVSDVIPTRTGYRFLGWNENKTATAASVTAGQKINITGGGGRTITLYAVWQANTFSIRYNANSGTGTMTNSQYTYDAAKALTANAFTKSGLFFAGWAFDAEDEVVFADRESVKNLSITNGAVVDLYAVWQASAPVTYLISYNANGGSGAPSAQTKTQGVVLSLSATVPTHSGYLFKGWATSASATTAQYQPGGQYTADVGVTLYAVWEQEAVTPPPNPVNTIFGTKYEATFMNWILFIVFFGWLWMWFI